MSLFEPNVSNMKDKRNVKGLIKALGYSKGCAYYRVREEASEALGLLGDAEAVWPLIAVLEDNYSGVQHAAAEALGRIGDARAVEPLIVALKDRECRVRWAAVKALGKIGDPRVVEPLMTALKNANIVVEGEYFVEALAQIGTPGIEALIALLNDGNFDVRREAAKALQRLGWQPDRDETAAAFWIALSEWDRCAAIGPSAIEPLIAALLLSNKLHGYNGEIWKSAAKVLVKIGSPAVEALVALLNHEYRWIRIQGAMMLEQIADARAVEPLIVTLKDAELYVREAAAEALERLGWQPTEMDEYAVAFWVARHAWDRCIHIGASVVGSLIAVLKDKEAHEVRIEAATALGRIGDARAVNPLIAVLMDKEAHHVHVEAATALGLIGDARAVKPLITALKSGSWRGERRAAAEALVRIYQHGQLDEARKCLILVERERIVERHDDCHIDGCAGFERHTDTGIGVDFPL